MSELSVDQHKCPACGHDAPIGGSGNAPRSPGDWPLGDPEVARGYARSEQERQVAALIRRLSPREHQVLRLLVDGHRAAAVGEPCGVTLPTVRDDIQAILAKLEVRSQLEAVAMAFDQLHYGGPEGTS